MNPDRANDGYVYFDGEHNCSHSYLLPGVERLIRKRYSTFRDLRMFDLGCGNGSVAAHFAEMGANVSGIDPSTAGITQANASYPALRLTKGSAYDTLGEQYGSFPLVISLEVVEHLYFPRRFAQTLFQLTEPGGLAIVSTPYHGYWKNVALSLTGRMDAHFTALWDHGHIKFWSRSTLTTLLCEAGFKVLEFVRVGRVPTIAKSMIISVERPSSS